MRQRPDWNYWDASDLIKKGKLDIGDGYRAKNSEMGDEGLPFARAGNVNNGFHFDDADILSKESVDKAKAAGKLSRPGDVTFTSKGTFGRFAYVSERTRQFVYSPQLCYWRVKDHRLIDRRFLYYWMQGPDSMNQLVQIKGLTDMADYVSLTNQRRMWLTAPPLPTQRKIATVLSAYDDLIENNLRRIKILEEMAQNLYREWFVKFRFPGYQHARFTDFALGRIPERWEVKRLDQVVAFQNNGTEAGEHLSDRVYLPIDCIQRKSLAINEIGSWKDAQSSLHLFDAGDILFGAMRPYFHKVVVAPFKGVTRRTCFVFKSALPEYHAFAALTLFQDSTVSFANAHSKGATIPYAVWPHSMDGMSVVVPAIEQAEKFEDAVGPMIARIGTMFFQNTALRRTRDLLLPRLISGEMDVSELDIAVPEEVAV